MLKSFALFVLSHTKSNNQVHEIFHINTFDEDSSKSHTVVKVDIPSSLVNHRHKKYKMMHNPDNGKRHLTHKVDKDYRTYHYDKWSFN